MADSEMMKVLEKLQIKKELAKRFQEEKITPDIICKLSLDDFRQLGVVDRCLVMKLRVECLKYGNDRPLTLETSRKYNIAKNVLENLIDEGSTVREMAATISVSERTIYRRMTEFNLSTREFSKVEDVELDGMITNIVTDFPCNGEVMLNELLKGRGIYVQRFRLRDSIHRVDESSVQARKKGRLKRRTYNVIAPNHLWHVDTNHKLVKWYFIVFGAIDGFSRLPVSLECMSDNKSETVFSCFLKGTQKYGLPSRVRSDQGKENVLIADFMIEKRGVGRGSMITGKSTHNQRIERLWRDVWDGVLALHYEFFTFMEENQILHPLNPVDITALHFVFLPLINEKLDAWRNAWSKHRI